ncbi:MAG: hypothetical protein LBM93_02565, partial [Oscillospiraceae bacterium]|nr:hypothetical protein [Oscillospiraceae bacterium]
GTLISTSPLEFSSGSVWNDIQTLSNNVIVPIGTLIFMVIMVADLIQTITGGNQFQDDTWETYFWWSVNFII